jgi:hypothetical protein
MGLTAPQLPPGCPPRTSTGPAGSTQIGWDSNPSRNVPVADLRDRGVAFEEYDLPGLKTIGGIADIDGNYPSRGAVGERGAWFYDSEGNLVGIGQPVH